VLEELFLSSLLRHFLEEILFSQVFQLLLGMVVLVEEEEIILLLLEELILVMVVVMGVHLQHQHQMLVHPLVVVLEDTLETVEMVVMWILLHKMEVLVLVVLAVVVEQPQVQTGQVLVAA
jgi:hypothetical protein